MSDFLNQQIAPPEFWHEFEKLCADLWKRILNDPNTEMNGRSGQKQHGVDVYGIDSTTERQYGIQCKGKDGRYGEEVTTAELHEEIEKAKTFEPPLSVFIIATTAKNDAKSQKEARKISKRHKRMGLFEVHVMGWNEIHRRLSDHDDLIEKYYPNQSPRLKRLLDNIENINKNQFEDGFQKIAELVAETTAKRVEKHFLSQEHSDLPSSTGLAGYLGSINAEIDDYRDLILEHKSLTALELLKRLKIRCWNDVQDNVRFRIVTNMASAHLNLANKFEAADLFLEALNYSPDQEKALCNAALAYLLRADSYNANRYARKAIGKYPNSARGYAYLIASSGPELLSSNPENSVPLELLDNSEVCFAISEYYRVNGKLAKAEIWINNARRLSPDNKEICISYAVSLLEKHLQHRTVLVGNPIIHAEGISDLREAADIFKSIWDEIKATEIPRENTYIAVNLIIVYRLLDEYDLAEIVANEALTIFPSNQELHTQKITIELDRGNSVGALKAIKKLDGQERLKSGILVSEALAASGDFVNAMSEICSYINREVNSQSLTIAKGLRFRYAYHSQGFEKCSELIQSTLREQPDSIILRVFAARAYHLMNKDALARKEIDIALGILQDSNDITDKLIVAEGAFHTRKYEDAGNIYREIISDFTDSLPLRRLLICYYESDQRADALGLLSKLSDNTKRVPFYKKISSAIHLSIGDIKKAKDDIESYLKDEPKDLNSVISKIGMMARLGEDDEIAKYISKLGDFPLSSPKLTIQFSHVLAKFGFFDKALETGYRLLRENPNDIDVNIGYFGLILMVDSSASIREPQNIRIGSSFALENKKGKETYFIREREYGYPIEGEIAEDHPISIACIGKEIGDKVQYQINPYQNEEGSVCEIKSKYVHLLHSMMNTFSKKFPSDYRLMQIALDTKGGNEPSFEVLFKTVSEREERVKNVLQLYKKEPYPIGIIANLLGVSALDAWRGFQHNEEVPIFCCDGNQPERSTAFCLINGASGCVIDPLTLYTIHDLSVYDEIKGVFPKIATTQSCLNFYQDLIEYRKFQKKEGFSRLKKDGQNYILDEITPEMIESEVENLSATYDSICKNVEILPAIGKIKVPETARLFCDNMHNSFCDCILLADGCNRILLSDDQRLRGFAKQFWNLDGVWLQSALMVALDRKLMTLSKYSDITAELIKRGFFFTTVNHNVIMDLVGKEGWDCTSRIKNVVYTLAGDRCDVSSSLLVAINFLKEFWSTRLLFHHMEAITFLILSTITNDGKYMVDFALRKILFGVSIQVSSKVRNAFFKAIRNWCDSHFLEFPQP